MVNNNSIKNSAIIVYEYSSNPEEPVSNNCKCACTKLSIKVLYPIDISISMQQYGECYKFVINIKSIAEYPVNVWIRILLPEYLSYDNCSFQKNGFSIGYVNLCYDVCIGDLQPGQSVNLSFVTWLNQKDVEEICIDTITYYNILIPYTAADWRCIEENNCFALNSADV